MKKKLELFFNVILILLLIGIVVTAENRVERAIDMICYIAGFGGLRLMIDQFDEKNEKKLSWKQFFFFDAVMIVVGAILICVFVTGIDLGSNGTMAVFCFCYLLCLVFAIFGTCSVLAAAFGNRYIYAKKKIEIDGKEFDVDIFTKVNYKGNVVKIEVVAEVGEKKLTAEGADEAEATENLFRCIRNELNKHRI